MSLSVAASIAASSQGPLLALHAVSNMLISSKNSLMSSGYNVVPLTLFQFNV